jgi:hypothetical protein
MLALPLLTVALVASHLSNTPQDAAAKARQCEAVYSAAKASAYAGFPYTYADVDEPVNIPGQFKCRFATTQGPGERMLVFGARPDARKAEFNIARRMADPLPAAQFGPDAFFEKTAYTRPGDSTATTVWRLTAHRDGSLYEISLIQYKDEPAAKAAMKEIFDGLIARR